MATPLDILLGNPQLGARATSRLLDQPEPEELLAPPAEEPTSVLGQVGGAALDGLMGLAHLLDTPGRGVRRALAGENPFGNAEVSGRDILENVGLADENRPGMFNDFADTAGDVGGFLTEIALDPLTYIGPGAFTKAGKGIAMAGSKVRAADRAARTALQTAKSRAEELAQLAVDATKGTDDVAKAAAKKAALDAGAVSARAQATADAAREAAAKGGQLADTWGNRIRAGQSNLISIGTPLGPEDWQYAINIGSKNETAAKIADIMGMPYDAFMGTAMGRQLAAVFDPRVRDATDAVAQENAKRATDMEEMLRQGYAGDANDLGRQANEVEQSLKNPPAPPTPPPAAGVPPTPPVPPAAPNPVSVTTNSQDPAILAEAARIRASAEAAHAKTAAGHAAIDAGGSGTVPPNAKLGPLFSRAARVAHGMPEGEQFINGLDAPITTSQLERRLADLVPPDVDVAKPGLSFGTPPPPKEPIDTSDLSRTVLVPADRYEVSPSDMALLDDMKSARDAVAGGMDTPPPAPLFAKGKAKPAASAADAAPAPLPKELETMANDAPREFIAALSKKYQGQELHDNLAVPDALAQGLAAYHGISKKEAWKRIVKTVSTAEYVRYGDEATQQALPKGIGPGGGKVNAAQTRQLLAEDKIFPVKGLTEGVNRDIIRLYKGADATTFLHEVFHAVTPNLIPEHAKILGDFARAATKLEFDPTNIGAWPREAHEALAKTWEDFLATGKAPTPQLKGVFERIAVLFRNVYAQLKRTLGMAGGTAETDRVFSEMLNPGVMAQKGGKTSVPELVSGQVLSKASEKELILAVKAGNREAFDELVRKYRGDKVAQGVNTVESKTKRGTQGTAVSGIEDIAQESLLKLWKSRDTLDENKPFSQWISTVTRSKGIDANKAAKLRIKGGISGEDEVGLARGTGFNVGKDGGATAAFVDDAIEAVDAGDTALANDVVDEIPVEQMRDWIPLEDLKVVAQHLVKEGRTNDAKMLNAAIGPYDKAKTALAEFKEASRQVLTGKPGTARVEAETKLAALQKVYNKTGQDLTERWQEVKKNVGEIENVKKRAANATKIQAALSGADLGATADELADRPKVVAKTGAGGGARARLLGKGVAPAPVAAPVVREGLEKAEAATPSLRQAAEAFAESTRMGKDAVDQTDGISVVALRDHMGLPREQFDKMVLDAVEKGEIQAHTAEIGGGGHALDDLLLDPKSGEHYESITWAKAPDAKPEIPAPAPSVKPAAMDSGVKAKLLAELEEAKSHRDMAAIDGIDDQYRTWKREVERLESKLAGKEPVKPAPVKAEAAPAPKVEAPVVGPEGKGVGQLVKQAEEAAPAKAPSGVPPWAQANNQAFEKQAATTTKTLAERGQVEKFVPAKLSDDVPLSEVTGLPPEVAARAPVAKVASAKKELGKVLTPAQAQDVLAQVAKEAEAVTDETLQKWKAAVAKEVAAGKSGRKGNPAQRALAILYEDVVGEGELPAEIVERAAAGRWANRQAGGTLKPIVRKGAAATPPAPKPKLTEPPAQKLTEPPAAAAPKLTEPPAPAASGPPQKPPSPPPPVATGAAAAGKKGATKPKAAEPVLKDVAAADPVKAAKVAQIIADAKAGKLTNAQALEEMAKLAPPGKAAAAPPAAVVQNPPPPPKQPNAAAGKPAAPKPPKAATPPTGGAAQVPPPPKGPNDLPPPPKSMFEGQPANSNFERVVRKLVEEVDLNEADLDFIKNNPEGVRNFAKKLRAKADEFLKQGQELGIVQNLEDVVKYFLRESTEMTTVDPVKVKKSGMREYLTTLILGGQKLKGKKLLQVADWSNNAREEVLRGWKGGTVAINDFVRHYAGQPITAQMKHDLTLMLAPDAQTEKRIKATAEYISGLSKDYHGANAPEFFDLRIVDNMWTNQQRMARKISGAHAIHRMFAETGEKGLAQSGAVKLGAAFKQAGLDAGEEKQALQFFFKENADVLKAKGVNTFEDLENFAIPEEMVKQAQRFIRPIEDPANLEPFLKFWDKATDLTKGALTIMWPANWARNLFSGQYANYVSGAFDVKSFKEAMDVAMGKDNKYLAEMELYAVLDPRSGYRGFGAHKMRDVRKVGDKRITPAGLYAKNRAEANLPGVLGAWEAGGQTAAGLVEVLNRATAYIAMRKKGYEPIEAAMRTKATQFDYASLTTAERMVVKRLVPFMTYTKWNALWHMKELAEHPGGMVAQSIRGAKVAREDAEVPPWLDGFVSPLGTSEDGKSMRYLTGLGLPFEEVSERFYPSSARRTAESHLAMLHPFVKGPLEALSGRQFFSGREMADLQSFPTGSPLADQVLFNSPVSRAISTGRTLLDDRKGIGAKALNTLTGAKISDVDIEQAKKAARREELRAELEGSSNITTRKILQKKKDAELTPEEKKLLAEYQKRK